MWLCKLGWEDGSSGLKLSSNILSGSSTHIEVLKWFSEILVFPRVFLCSSGFSWVRQNFPGFFRVCLGLSRFFRVLQGLSGFVRVFPGLSGFVRVLRVYQCFSAPRRYQGAREPCPGRSRERVGPGCPGSAWARPRGVQGARGPGPGRVQGARGPGPGGSRERVGPA